MSWNESSTMEYGPKERLTSTHQPKGRGSVGRTSRGSKDITSNAWDQPALRRSRCRSESSAESDSQINKCRSTISAFSRRPPKWCSREWPAATPTRDCRPQRSQRVNSTTTRTAKSLRVAFHFHLIRWLDLQRDVRVPWPPNGPEISDSRTLGNEFTSKLRSVGLQGRTNEDAVRLDFCG